LLLPSATFRNGILLFADCRRILEQPIVVAVCNVLKWNPPLSGLPKNPRTPIVVAVCNVLPWNPPLLDWGRILEQQQEEELDDFMQGVCL
jgi:hypothetical protein